MRRAAILFGLLASALPVPWSPAQDAATGAGLFVNFEEPQTKPITVVTVTTGSLSRRYLAVCNTPDNSVEFYRANWPWTFVRRVRTGLGPVTVRWNPALSRLYVCNFSGDSVTVIRLEVLLSTPGDPLRATLERTVDVGDEPCDIAFTAANGLAHVTLNTRHAVTVRNAVDLSVVTAEDRLDLMVGSVNHAVKAPRQIWIDGNDRRMVLNFMGGIEDLAAGADYDLDLYVDDPALGTVSRVGGLGSTHHAFAVTPDGTRMFVVGTRARNRDAQGVAAVSQLPTGFVQSWLWVLDVPPAGAPSLAAEAPAGAGPWPVFRSVNLNRDYTSAVLGAVPAGGTLSQPADVVVVPDAAGGVQKLFVTAFHSDRIARLSPDAASPGGWNIQRIPILLLNGSSAAAYSVAGPRGLAFGAGLRGPNGIPDDLVFVANRLDNTVFVLSATSELPVGHFALRNDPTSFVIRRGRAHLYDAKTHSGSGTVSCASCHVDGRTDALPWNLGKAGAGPVIPPGFHDANGQSPATMALFPEDKGDMVTQTLQGLVNYPTNEGGQPVFTNAPYHWRGDKAAFDDFNEAFVNLQGVPDPDADGKGISDAAMRDYRLFVNTIRHPPNRDQDRARIQTGVLGPDPNDPAGSTGSNQGMVLFHNVTALGTANQRACVDCHSLPDGSSNTSTLTFNVARTVTTGTPDPQAHPFETAALRNIRQRERLFLAVGESAKTGNFGLFHSGQTPNNASQEVFILQTFGPLFPGQQILNLIEFVQKLDTGIGPSATLVHTLGQPADAAMFALLEGQAEEGNIGLAAYARNGASEKGYWYDVTAPAGAKYREEGTANLVTQASLIAIAATAGNAVVLQGCPSGTERRWASAAGSAALLTGAAPASVVLERAAPGTPYVGVAALTNFAWQGNTGGPFPPVTSNMWSRQAFQLALIPNPSFGVPGQRHEPPRRFRVSGDNIRPGAVLHFAIPMQGPQTFPVWDVILDLVPTRYTGTGGRRIWESSQEIDELMTLALLNGGFWAPDVVPVLFRTTPAPALQPVAWNGYLAIVENEDGSLDTNFTNWQPFRVQDTR